MIWLESVSLLCVCPDITFGYYSVALNVAVCITNILALPWDLQFLSYAT